MPRLVRAWPYLAALALACALTLHARALHYTGDDGFITLRYVRNLLEGNGLVFNEGERVEGYTNFLWVILLAAIGKLVHAPLDAEARVAGVACAIATLLVLTHLSWRIANDRGPLSMLAPLLLASSTAYAAWAEGMLENALFSLLIVGAASAYAAYLDDRLSLGWTMALLAAATLTRPEGLMLFAVTLAFEASRRRLARDGPREPWTKPLALFALGVAPHIAWRAWYYGALVPNTFHAKVAPSLDAAMRGLEYVHRFGVSGAAPLLVLPFAIALRRPFDARLAYAAALSAAYVAYIVFVGGDGLAFDRFFTYVLPLLCLLAQEGLRALLASIGRASIAKPAAAFFVIVLVIASSWRGAVAIARPAWPWFRDPASELHFPGDGREHSYAFFDQYYSARVARAGAWLDRNAPRGALVAANPAGIAYSVQLPVLDMLGLNDPVIARSRPPGMGRERAGHGHGDGRYVLSRKPEYILLGNVAVLPFALDDDGMKAHLFLLSEIQIWADPSFRLDYERVVVRLEETGPFQYFTFYRRRERGP